MAQHPAQIILLNGASSAGKSTLCRHLQAQLPQPFLYFALDLLLFDEGIIAKRPGVEAFEWSRQRPRLFDGYHRSLAAFAAADNHLIADYVLETKDTLADLARLLAPFDVFFVGVHCPVPELDRRERARGDRRIGDAREDYERVHTFSGYDFEVDSLGAPEDNAARIVAAWQARTGNGAFEKLSANPT
ncbi:chloramphenicol phosphotransferase [Deinococcus psychrotolerans]|uniref:Chloramphenicol phosphotransferase n=1 Tax=Deinococcus psychrotolerans TaxID=2489213 RepID=A0A3G8YNF7_9DEIO|nr:chloramphenicol phosphotransferase [Deinococcus psychrotolerans]AZI43121.1 chloramphenicol phosphotransferase [Deinococcus psychrotolerans]